MKPLSRVLVATDLSAPARHAVERAFDLASGTECNLYILHVTELGTLDALLEALGDDMFQVKAALNRDARDNLEQLTRHCSVNRRVTPNICIADGNPLETIATEAENLDAELLVLGARGESFLRHSLPGSTTARLLRKSAQQPVLIVKQPPRGPYRSVLVAVDFSAVSLEAIRSARRVAPDAELVLLHAFDLPYEGKLKFAGVEESVIGQYIRNTSETQRRRLHELAAEAGLATREYSARIVRGEPAQQVIVAEQDIDADLIVIGKHGTHIVEELLIGSVTKHVLAESQCDLLVLSDHVHS